MASTLGSLAAVVTKSTTGSNESKGWCSKISRRAIASNTSSPRRQRIPARRLRRKRRISQEMRDRAFAPVPSRPSNRRGRECGKSRCKRLPTYLLNLAAILLLPDRLTNSSFAPTATSSRTASPRCRALMRSSISRNMSSDSCSNISISLSRVMRKVVQSKISKPPNNSRQPCRNNFLKQYVLQSPHLAPPKPNEAKPAEAARRQTTVWDPSRSSAAKWPPRYNCRLWNSGLGWLGSIAIGVRMGNARS